MAETLGVSDTYYMNDGVYSRIDVPSGVVYVPRTTGFKFIDDAITPPSTGQGDTLVAERELLFGPSADVRAWMDADARREGDIPPEAIDAAITGMQCFLTAIRDNPGIVLTPSKYIDRMWHRYMTRPRDYWQACEEAGIFIDHVPNKPDGSRPPDALDVEQTYQFLIDSGYEPNLIGWPAGDAGGDCGGRDCTGGDCTSGGPARFTSSIMNSTVEI